MNKLRLRKNPKGEMKKPRVWQKKLQNGCTLRKESEESNRLKRKYEDMQREMKSSRAEVQALQGEIQVLETTQESLKRVQKEYQELGTDQNLRFTLRVGSAFIQASEDNVRKIMIDLEQSKKYSS